MVAFNTTVVNLERFGFTPTEGRVYAALLGLGASTGYAVARELGIARANVYQALEGLVRRGAARRSATIPAQYAALAPATLLSSLQRSFSRDLADLEDALRSLPRAGTTAAKTGLEVITTTAALADSAAACADGAETELLAVTGPWAPPLNQAIERAASRGVVVRAVSLMAPAPEGASLRPVAESDLRAYWGGLPVAVAADRGRAVFGTVQDSDTASALTTDVAGVVPFIRHLLRRETTGAA